MTTLIRKTQGLLPSQVHIDQALTQLSIAYMNDASNYVADRIFPIVPVAKQTDRFHVFGRDAFLRSQAQRRAPGSKAVEKQITLSNSPYSCDVWSIEFVIPDELRANADPAVPMEEVATRALVEDLRLARERQFVTDMFTTGVWGTDFTPTVLWSDGASSNPIQDVANARIAVWQATGMKPNKMVVGPRVDEALKRHPMIVERFKYTTPVIPNTLLAAIFEVEEYLVAGSVNTTSLEGAATLTNAFVAGNNALLTYTPSAPNIVAPAAGYVFAWSGLFGGQAASAAAVETRREGVVLSDAVRRLCAFDMVVTGAPLGYFFSGVVA